MGAQCTRTAFLCKWFSQDLCSPKAPGTLAGLCIIDAHAGQSVVPELLGFLFGVLQ